MANVTKTKHVTHGDWRTLESGWNINFHIAFLGPKNAQVKVRYGLGWLGWDSQNKTLNGQTSVTLEVSSASVTYARVQIKVQSDADVTYTYIPA